MLDGLDINVMIEPNAKLYGGEYFHTVDEIVGFIETNGFKNIKTMIDLHNSILENKNPIDEYNLYKDYIGHIHVSEPNLSLIEETDLHIQFSKLLKNSNYNKIITYEVKKCDGILNNIKLFSKIYN